MTPLKKHSILATLALTGATCSYGWDWPNWSSWIPASAQMPIVWKPDEAAKTKSAEPIEQDDTEEIFIGDLAEEISEQKATEQKPTELAFDYDALGIKLLSPENPYVTGSYESLSDWLELVYKKTPELAAGYFISIERANHDAAMKLIEDDTLSHDLRLHLLTNFPSAYTAKVLRDLHKDFAGKKIYHWGAFEAAHPYYNRLQLKHAVVHAEALPLIYITYILFTPPNHEARNQATFNERLSCVMHALAMLNPEEVASMLVVEDSHASFQIGLNNPKCLGAVKSHAAKLCEQKHELKLSPAMLASFIQGFNTNEQLADTAAKITERQVRLRPHSANELFKLITKNSLKQMAPFLADDIKHMLPGDIAVDIIADHFGVNAKNSEILQLPSISENNTAYEQIVSELSDNDKHIV